MLLFKDSIRLFAAYNEGIINLLGMWEFFLAFELLCKILRELKNIDNFWLQFHNKLSLLHYQWIKPVLVSVAASIGLNICFYLEEYIMKHKLREKGETRTKIPYAQWVTFAFGL